MATFIVMMGRRRDVVNKLFENTSEAEDQRNVEYAAAVKIQSWFRGVRVRAYIRYTQEIFSTLKGPPINPTTWTKGVPPCFLLMLSEDSQLLKSSLGYYTRKYVHNFYSRKAFLEGLAFKNKVVREQLQKMAVSSAKEAERKQVQEDKAAKQREAEKTHYLISTHQIPGVYCSPFKGRSAKEMELQSTKPLSPKSRNALSARLRTGKNKSLNNKENDDDEQSMKYKPLPPINTNTIQGPFRTPNEVREQRHKSLNPSLRVATSYDSADQTRMEMKAKEWVTRVIDDQFVPFTHRHRLYEPLLHTTSTYGSLSYGSKHFREESKIEHITSQRFKTVVSPIPVFEQFGKTY
ncbi:hypothetical protein QZH41_013784 [Actinostola sp. cb2023]|nr:hypothetical protein QZH41_013784 [Actinostola sp. cb2023]